MEFDKAARGRRVVELQDEHGEEGDNIAFVERLNRAARELGLPEEWNSARLAKIRNGGQNLSPEDGLVLSSIDPKGRGYTWIMYGVPVRPGEDALQALARAAKRRA